MLLYRDNFTLFYQNIVTLLYKDKFILPCKDIKKNLLYQSYINSAKRAVILVTHSAKCGRCFSLAGGHKVSWL